MNIPNNFLNQLIPVQLTQDNLDLKIWKQVQEKEVTMKLRKALRWKNPMLHLQVPLRFKNQTILKRAVQVKPLGQSQIEPIRLKRKIMKVRTRQKETKHTQKILHHRAFKVQRLSKTVFVLVRLLHRRLMTQKRQKHRKLKRVYIQKHLMRQVWDKVRVP